MSDRFEQHDGTIPSADNSNASRASTSSHPELTRSSTSTSTTSLFLEHIHDKEGLLESNKPYKDRYDGADNVKSFEDFDIEEANTQRLQTVDLRWKRWLWSIAVVSALGWLVTLGFLIRNGAYKHRSTFEHDPAATVISGTGKKISVEQLQRGLWFPQSHAIEWIGGPNGEDGLLLEMQGAPNSDYLVVSDVRKGNTDSLASDTITLMKQGSFETSSGEMIFAQSVWPSPDLKTVLVMSEKQKNWRHSYTGLYWLFDVESQTGQALDLGQAEARIQLALWSPTSDAVVFTRDNNMFLRRLDSDRVVQVTNNGGDQMFNGVPDWVYEEEVFSGNSATWWSGDGKYIAFLATNESQVPEYPVQYFISRPSGSIPKEGLENYPEVRQIKYPKAGAPNPSVSIRFYDLNEDHVFDIPIARDFTDAQRLITEVIWAGKTGKVLVRETSRESDVLKMVLMDVVGRTGSIVREQNVMELDGGWFEISETTTFVPADPANGRPYDGYIDTVIYENYDHLGYFAPLDNPEPLLLTTGQWEVENAPSALDIAQNCVYFIATKEGSIQRHVYKVNLDGSNLESITDISKEGYYSASFSKGAGYALLSYKGPGIPWQKVISTPGTSPEYEHLVEDNRFLGQMAKEYELPIKVFSTISIDGLELNVVERRPPHFDKRKKYPVLFYLYGGPGSQTVDKKFSVDFQSYVAATLGYIVVTVDGRGTGLIGRKARTIVRGNLGYWEAHDQIETAKLWAQKSYVDPTRIAIWGWSYGGFMTLKTLEQDAGRTFRYGMAVAPVTDWAFYDTIYTERYMHTPQHNPGGYSNASISNTTALSQNVRFLVMHGVADDNVHMQNTLALLDELDLNGVENYDVHFFPDSDHSIYFHNANWIVYDKLSWWLTNAFNGEWAKIKDVQPLREGTLVGSNS